MNKTLESKYMEEEYMIIDKIYIDGFKNLEDIVIDMKDIVALVSANNYGKSNVLTAIKFGFDFFTVDSDSMRLSMMEYEPAIPINSNPKKTFRFGIEGRTFKADKVKYIKYEYAFNWVGAQKENITYENLLVKEDGSQKPRYRDYIFRDTSEEARYLRSEKGRCSSKISMKKGELALRKLMAYDKLFYLDILTVISNVTVQVEEHFNAKPEASTPFSFLSKDEPILSLNNIRHLPRFLYHMKEEYEHQYALLLDSIKQLIPSIEDITPIQLSTKKHIRGRVVALKLEGLEEDETDNDDPPFVFDDSIYQLFVTYKNLNQPLEINRMSDGTCRVLLLLTAAVNASIHKVSLMCFEEMENFIHPKLFRDMLEIVLQLAGSCRIILTSHSPYMLQFIDLDKIYIGLPNEDGKGSFLKLSHKGQSSLINASSELEMSSGEFIFDGLAGDDDAFEILQENLVRGEW